MKAKPIIIVVITLIIGFVLGMLTSAQIRFNKLKPVRVYFSEERFKEGFYKTIEPGEKQKAEIQKILDKYAKLNSELQGNFRKQLDSNMKDFRKEIDSKLTKDQLARMKEIDERRQQMINHGRRDMRDSSQNGDMRRFERNRGQFPNDGHMRPGDRQGPPEGRPPMPPRDSAALPDSK
ncbi:MAG: hypothetical protein NT092_08675 [Bacteroidia bacterium]|nr:hypothetical protein [Bacteroidia bacterium]